jgi:MFS family permease
VVYEERNIWSGLIVMPISMTIYVIVILQQAAGRTLTDVVWWPIMAWTIGASIVATIIVSILWGIIAGITDPEGVGKSDQRDRDISRMSDRVGKAFIVIGGLGVIVLSAFEADWFWIANAMFFAFAISATMGSVAAAIAYRRGLA